MSLGKRIKIMMGKNILLMSSLYSIKVNGSIMNSLMKQRIIIADISTNMNILLTKSTNQRNTTKIQLTIGFLKAKDRSEKDLEIISSQRKKTSTGRDLTLKIRGTAPFQKNQAERSTSTQKDQLAVKAKENTTEDTKSIISITKNDLE